jgi:hypothetical protein
MCDIKKNNERQLNMVPIPKLEALYSDPPVKGHYPNQVLEETLEAQDLAQILPVCLSLVPMDACG